MMAQQLALQSPCGHMCLRPAAWRVSHRVSPLSRASVFSAAANIVNGHVRPTSSSKAIDTLNTAVVPVAGAAAAESNKFFEVYVLGKHIGSGAYGQVQLVIERATGQCAAVKLLPKIRGKLSKVPLAVLYCCVLFACSCSLQPVFCPQHMGLMFSVIALYRKRP